MASFMVENSALWDVCDDQNVNGAVSIRPAIALESARQSTSSDNGTKRVRMSTVLCVCDQEQSPENSLPHICILNLRYAGEEPIQLEVFAVVEIQWTLMIENEGNGLSLDEPHT